MHGTSTLPIGTIYGIPEDYHLLAQGHKIIKGRPPAFPLNTYLDILVIDLGAGCIVRDLAVDLVGEKIVPCGERTLTVPSYPHEIIEWDAEHAPSGEIRVLVDKKVYRVNSICGHH